MKISAHISYFWAVCCVVLNTVCSQDIIGCGGFVKSEVEINFSLIEVKLLTKQGSLKYQTDCAPNNGYYMIPVYDKGDYVIRVQPPPGWTFEPLSVDIRIDGETDQCSKGEDINFQFTGFGVVGKVVTKGQSVGPAGVNLALMKTETKEEVKSTQSLVDGDFTFEHVLPGKYYILASHPVWTFQNPSVDVVVDRETGSAGTSLTVAGFDVKGEVLSDGDPVSGVYFLLYSASVNPKMVVGCEHSDVAGMPGRAGQTMLCYLKSKDDGTFVFPAVPTGSYTLVPFYRAENIFFDVQPNSVDFVVKQDSVKFQDSFQVAGFSVSGRVLHSKQGSGVKKARILVDNQETTSTDQDGGYVLESMKTGTYSITVLTDHVYFDPTQVKISPSTPQLPDIIAARFSVCGQVVITQLPEGLGHVTQSRKILVSDKTKGSEVATKGTDGDGNFCVQLKPGSYVVKVVLSNTEQKSGLRLTPDSVEVTVVNKPLNGVIFTQFRATVSGQVHCTEWCDSVQLSINALGRTEERKTVQAKETEKGKATFVFDSIMPGKYRVSIHKEEWCWEEKQVEVEVSGDNVDNIVFTQSGYILTTSLSHHITLKFEQESSPGNVGSFNLTKGVNKFCLKGAGVYLLTPGSCHQFEQDVYKYDTSRPSVLALTAVKHRVEGAIVTSTRQSDITVHIKSSTSEQGSVLGPLLSDKESLPDNDTSAQTFTYKYQYWARAGEVIDVSVMSATLLFYPPTTQVTIVGDACPKPVPEIEGRLGVFISGQIQPPIAGVALTITSQDIPYTTIDVLTDDNGEYSVGPLHSHTGYSITASKEGYILTPHDTKQGHFLAFKLAEVSVQVEDEAGEPLSGVLLSLSGGSFRSNKVTNDDGTMVFLGLSPGQFFLRPMMKEYEFEPASQMIDVLEGSTAVINVKALRVAYSCYGSVTSLNGEAEVGVYVEAVGLPNNRGEQCNHLQEEAQTESDGSFRIRGLQPQCEYVVRVRVGEVNQHIERATPRTHTVQAVNTDIHNIHIIAFRRLNQLDISGNVVSKQEFISTLKVQLYRENNPDSPVHTVSLGDISFFFLPSLTIDNQVYYLRLLSSLSRSSYDYDLPEVTFTANTTHEHFTFTFEPKRRTVEQELSQSSILVLPLTLLIILLCYNHHKLLPLVTEAVSWLQSTVRTVTPTAPPPSQHINPELLADLMKNAKKKTKLRKA